MNRLGSGFLFVCAYVLAIAIAANAHAEHILRDTFFEVSFVIRIYVVFMAPVAVVALVCTLYPDFQARTRASLALLFGALIGVGVYTLVAAAQSSLFGTVVRKHQVGSYVAVSALVSLSIVAIAVLTRRLSTQP